MKTAKSTLVRNTNLPRENQFAMREYRFVDAELPVASKSADILCYRTASRVRGPTPNATTAKVLAEVEAGKNMSKRFSSVSELLEDLASE